MPPYNDCFHSAEGPACSQRPLDGESIQRASHDGAQRDTGGDDYPREGKGHQLLHKGKLLKKIIQVHAYLAVS